MKLRKSKGVWDKFAVYNGRYRNFKVKISEASNETFGTSVDYFYYLADSDKHQITYNSLWGDEKFKTVEEAKEAVITYIDFAIK